MGDNRPNATENVQGLHAAMKLGFWAALFAFSADVGYDVVQVLQIANIPQHPWSDALVYGTSLCIASPFLVAMVALNYRTPTEKKRARRFFLANALVTP